MQQTQALHIVESTNHKDMREDAEMRDMKMRERKMREIKIQKRKYCFQLSYLPNGHHFRVELVCTEATELLNCLNPYAKLT